MVEKTKRRRKAKETRVRLKIEGRQQCSDHEDEPCPGRAGRFREWPLMKQSCRTETQNRCLQHRVLLLGLSKITQKPAHSRHILAMVGTEKINLGTSEKQRKCWKFSTILLSVTAVQQGRSPRELESGAETKQPPSEGRGQPLQKIRHAQSSWLVCVINSKLITVL